MAFGQQDLSIILIETAPLGMKGSMTAYTNMLLHLKQSEETAGKLHINKINLAPPLGLLNRIPYLFRNWFHHAWIMISAIIRLPGVECGVFHITDGSYAYIINSFKRSITVSTAHDIIPLLQTQEKFFVEPPGLLGSWLIKKSIDGLKKSDFIICVSCSTKNDLINSAGVPPGKIQVIHPAVPQAMHELAKMLTKKPWIEKRKKPYILHIGNNGFYKNREGVVRVFSLIGSQNKVRLKMAGPSPGDKLKTLVQRLGLADRVDFIVDPDNYMVAELYNNASLFLFPSHYEGFGWPPLEAMLFGCPAVCSNAASLPEVVGNAALTCSADDEVKMADNCAMILNDEVLAEKMIERGYARVKAFNIENMSREVHDVYRRVYSKKI